jgi:hypothetical protein
VAREFSLCAVFRTTGRRVTPEPHGAASARRERFGGGLVLVRLGHVPATTLTRTIMVVIATM